MDLARTRADIRQHVDTPQWRDYFGTEIRQVYFTDGNALFNRPSQRRVDSLDTLANCLHPEHFAATTLPLYKLIDTRLC
jgi:ABC-type Fe3+-hydroxamate transport system substrate-binding protein